MQRPQHRLGCSLLLAVAVFACGPSQAPIEGESTDAGASPATESDDGTHGASSTATATAADTSGDTSNDGGSSTGDQTGGSGSSSGSEDDGLLCPGINDCTVLPDCEAIRCGHVNSFLDKDGCPRPACDDNDACPDGLRCHVPFEVCGFCIDDNYACEASTSSMGPICFCGITENCNARWCVPDSIPVGDCQGDKLPPGR